MNNTDDLRPECAVKTMGDYIALLLSIPVDVPVKLTPHGYMMQIKHVQHIWPDEDPESWVLTDAVVHALAIAAETGGGSKR